MFLGLITRCLNEPYIAEFVNHYLNEGIDTIYIIDDNSKDGIYNGVKGHPQVSIVTDIAFNDGLELNVLYQRIREKCEWILVADMDEYVTTKKNINMSIREELQNTFIDADCIKIPWVMMSFNGLEHNPPRLLETNIYRWNHDKTHELPNAKRKFRCRRESIEVKCLFRTSEYTEVSDHHPSITVNRYVKRLLPSYQKYRANRTKVVDGVYNKPAKMNPFYANLREKDISNAYLLCFHYRVASIQQCHEKVKENHFFDYVGITAEDFIESDFPEIEDYTLRNKTLGRTNLL